jgi:hypothetical protein
MRRPVWKWLAEKRRGIDRVRGVLNDVIRVPREARQPERAERRGTDPGGADAA